MTNDRQKAKDLAAQILRDPRDLEWLHPLAREFVALVGREDRLAQREEAVERAANRVLDHANRVATAKEGA
jgi:hypothetical protein